MEGWIEMLLVKKNGICIYCLSHLSIWVSDLQQTTQDEHWGVMRNTAGGNTRMPGRWRMSVEKPDSKEPELRHHLQRLSASNDTKRNSEGWCQEFLWQTKRERERWRWVPVRTLNEVKPPLAFLITQPGLTSGHKTLQPDGHAGTKTQKNLSSLQYRRPPLGRADVTLHGSGAELWSWPSAKHKHKSFRERCKRSTIAVWTLQKVLNFFSICVTLCVTRSWTLWGTFFGGWVYFYLKKLIN